jgi:hypothetical protein
MGKITGPGEGISRRANSSRQEKEARASAENWVLAITYSIRGGMIHVDMVHKVVIIAIGGKIGKPFLIDNLCTLGTEAG